MVSFMNDPEPSTGVIDTSDAQKRKLAQKSLRWNLRNNNDFVRLFEPFAKQLGIDSDLFTDPSKIDAFEKDQKIKKKLEENLKEKPTFITFDKIMFVLASAFLIRSAYSYIKAS